MIIYDDHKSAIKILPVYKIPQGRKPAIPYLDNLYTLKHP